MTLNLSESMKLPFINVYTHRKRWEGLCVCKSKGHSVLDTVHKSGS